MSATLTIIVCSHSTFIAARCASSIVLVPVLAPVVTVVLVSVIVPVAVVVVAGIVVRRTRTAIPAACRSSSSSCSRSEMLDTLDMLEGYC